MFSERILKDNMNVKKCDLCGNVQMAVSIKIEDSEKTVCCKCTEALFFKMMYLVGAIPFESVEQLKEVTEPIRKDIIKKEKNEATPKKEKSIFTDEELSYIRAVEAGIPDSDIARIKGVPLEDVLKLAESIDNKSRREFNNSKTDDPYFDSGEFNEEWDGVMAREERHEKRKESE